MADSDYPRELRDYLNGLVPERAPELRLMEEYAAQHHFPIIGPASGQLCYQIARMIGARRVFELGSGYGYSTAWFARAVQENGGGEVFHVVWDEELSRRAREHLAKLGFAGIVRYQVSEATEALRRTDGPFDLIFNDIDKEGYPASLPVISEKLRPGGALIVDNMISRGRVWDQASHSPSLEGIRELTRLVTTSPDWIASILPVGDGVLLAYKLKA